ncbi:LOG family protein [Candidatus Woesearchaeota archaeon]|nr:LOG family protein [Candidatus Woesearchaeota archaeon]
MDKKLIQKIRKQKKGHLIGVIGATMPSPEYDQDSGVEIGQRLRRYLEGRDGFIFTGGVGGVGVDIYEGVIQECDINGYYSPVKGECEKRFDDRFFVLVPEYDEEIMPPKSLAQYLGFGGETVLSAPKRLIYRPPREYLELGESSSRGCLDIVRAGENMRERREYVAGIADVLVLVNGGSGTLDEAFNAMETSVPLIVMEDSGGAAALICEAKNDTPHWKIKEQLQKRNLSIEYLQEAEIYVCKRPDEISSCLERLF